jgi:hypothetical protein
MNHTFCQVALAFLVIASPEVRGQSMSLRPSGASGSITGVITDSSQKAVGGIYVAAIRVFPVQGATGPALFDTTADASGNFRLDNLPPASYKICVNASGQALLDPCLWSGTPPMWNLSGGQIAFVRVQLQAGAWLNLRVNDPGQKASAVEKPNGPPAYSFGIVARSGRIVNFEELARDTAGRTFRVVAPSQKSAQLVFSSTGGLAAGNRNGTAVTAVSNSTGTPTAGGPSTPSAGNAVSVLNSGSTPVALAVGQGDQNLEFEIQ